MQEQDAIQLLKHGDLAGLDALVRLHQYQAVRAATLIIRDRAAAEDVVQSAFLQAAQRIKQFDSTRPFGPWFLRSVVNAAIKEAQRRERMVSLEQAAAPASSAIEQLEAPNLTPEQLLEQGETRSAVVAALNQLTPLQRAAVVQRYYLGMSEAAMASRSATSAGAIKQRLFGARERLRHLLRPFASEATHSEQETIHVKRHS